MMVQEPFQCVVCGKEVRPHKDTGIPTYYKVLDMVFYMWFCDAICSTNWHEEQKK